MCAFRSSHLGPDHLVYIGAICVWWAELENLIDRALSNMLNTDFARGTIITANLTYPQKRDTLRVLIEQIPVAANRKAIFSSLLDRMDRAKRTRDTMAHAVWANGRKSNSIKPVQIRARGTLKILGFSHNEQEYTPDRLEDEANRIGDLMLEFAEFLEREGLWHEKRAKSDEPDPQPPKAKRPSPPGTRAHPPKRDRRKRQPGS